MKRFRQSPENQLLLEIRECLDRVEKRLNEPETIEREWLEPQQVCSILRIARSTLAEYAKKGYIPYSRLGGRVYFRLADIDDYLSSHIIRKEQQP